MRATFQLIGNLTRDPEIKTTVKGTAYARFSVAVNSYSKEQDGTLTQKTDFFNVVMMGKKAETFCKYHAKGNRVFVEGRLSISTWEDKSGNKRRDVELLAFDFDFIKDSKQNSESYQDNGNGFSSEFTPTNQQQEYEDDVVPF